MDAIAPRIEHTVLGPTTTWPDVETVLDAAREFGMRACIPPSYLPRARDRTPDVDLTTVVGFPHGQHATPTKVAEAETAAAAGAAELDVVAHLGHLLAGDEDRYVADLAAVVDAVDVPVKVIVEAPLLDEASLRRACAGATEAGADYVKTATGFSDGGATVADVAIMAEYLPVKASGGIGSWDDARAMFDAGAERIGASSGDAIVAEFRAATGAGGGTGDGDS